MNEPASNANAALIRKSVLYCLLCYILWGLFPLYWAPLKGTSIGADQILAYRIIFSAIFAFVLLVIYRQWAPVFSVLTNIRVLLLFFASAAILSVNWLTYLWGITNNHVLDASLGYFMSPLINIALGRLYLGDRLSLIQKISVVMAVIGVLWLAILVGSIPWVSIGISLSWGFYSLLRKMNPFPTLPGLAIETFMMLPFSVVYLIIMSLAGGFALSQLSTLPVLVMIGSGIMTTVPLLLFAFAARHISLSSLGMLQYVSPTIQFIIGLFIFHESFNSERFIGYLFVWIGTVLFAIGSYQTQHHQKLNKTNHENEPN